MTLVAGVDSSTQSCKVVIRDADSGALVRSGRAAHPEGTEVDPESWWAALQRALTEAGGLEDVAALAVGGQQHGMVCLDERGQVVRPALLWNDTRSAQAAEDLVAELGGGAAWAEAVGSVPVASFTITKLRWLAEHEPENARSTASVCLPHDWLTWRLSGAGDRLAVTTDRSDASGTGYWSGSTGYRADLLDLAMGATPDLPRVLDPRDRAAETSSGLLLGPGAGDNAAAALGLNAGPGDVVISLGTSGVVTAIASEQSHDGSGIIAGFADATGLFLPLVCTLNAARVLDAAGRMLGVDHAGLSDLALAAKPGAEGLVLVPYLEGERTPNLPTATGSVRGLTLDNATPAHLARAAVEGLLCGLAEGLDALLATGVEARRVLLVGGGSASPAVRGIAPTILGLPVEVPEPGEYVADGACRQAAWTLTGDDEPPPWTTGRSRTYAAPPRPEVREQYAVASARVRAEFAL